eukprot:gene28145-31248_t
MVLVRPPVKGGQKREATGPANSHDKGSETARPPQGQTVLPRVAPDSKGYHEDRHAKGTESVSCPGAAPSYEHRATEQSVTRTSYSSFDFNRFFLALLSPSMRDLERRLQALQSINRGEAFGIPTPPSHPAAAAAATTTATTTADADRHDIPQPSSLSLHRPRSTTHHHPARDDFTPASDTAVSFSIPGSRVHYGPPSEQQLKQPIYPAHALPQTTWEGDKGRALLAMNDRVTQLQEALSEATRFGGSEAQAAANPSPAPASSAPQAPQQTMTNLGNTPAPARDLYSHTSGVGVLPSQAPVHYHPAQLPFVEGGPAGSTGFGSGARASTGNGSGVGAAGYSSGPAGSAG